MAQLTNKLKNKDTIKGRKLYRIEYYNSKILYEIGNNIIEAVSNLDISTNVKDFTPINSWLDLLKSGQTTRSYISPYKRTTLEISNLTCLYDEYKNEWLIIVNNSKQSIKLKSKN